jgi:hypothetical protein
VLVSTWWVPGFRITMEAGPAWLAIVTICYLIWARVAREKHDSRDDLKTKLSEL